MNSTSDDAVEWLIQTVRTALEEGRASPSEVEAWLLAAISLEEIALEAAADDRAARAYASWTQFEGTRH